VDDGAVDLSDLAERIDFIGPKIGKLRGHNVVKVDPNDPIAVSKAKAAIKDRHKSWAGNKIDKTGTGGDGTHLLTVLRIPEFERYLRRRYGAELPDDDAGREDLVILLNHVAHNRTDPRGKMLGYVLKWAPWMPGNESEALVDMILIAPRKYGPKRLGELTRLTEAERDQRTSPRSAPSTAPPRAWRRTPSARTPNTRRRSGIRSAPAASAASRGSSCRRNRWRSASRRKMPSAQSATVRHGKMRRKH
jgi:hypothetical protein